jgi:hypothetical protein
VDSKGEHHDFAKKFLAAIRAKNAAEAEERRLAGKARFGGGYTMEYEVSYLSAARCVLNDAMATGTLDQMGPPCLYLQRHAAELLLKKFIEACQHLESMESTLRTGHYVPPNAPATTHDLLQLVSRARNELAKRQLPLPDSLANVATEIARFEDGDATRSRYDRGARGRGYETSSFPKEVLVPLRDWQEALEDVFQHIIIREDFAKESDRTVVESLFESSKILGNKLRAAGLWISEFDAFEWGPWFFNFM